MTCFQRLKDFWKEQKQLAKLLVEEQRKKQDERRART